MKGESGSWGVERLTGRMESVKAVRFISSLHRLENATLLSYFL